MSRLMQKNTSYPRGLCPAARRFAKSMQLALLERALAPWPRRLAPLLEVNCGNGAFLQFLWQCGFDVQGVEADPRLRLKAQKRPVPGLLIHAATDDNLPFANDAFDWVIIHLHNEQSIDQSTNEGVRLARRGIMLTFWNTASLPAYFWNLFHKKPWTTNAASWWLVWHKLHKLGLGRLATISTLATPTCVWRKQWGAVHTGMPFGAWCAVRLDMGPLSPVTPLPLRLGMRIPGAEPLMEYLPKRTDTSAIKWK